MDTPPDKLNLDNFRSSKDYTSVSVIIHDIQYSHIKNYEQIIEKFKNIIYQQKGFKSIDIIRPLGEYQRYITLIRFNNSDNANLWLNSTTRHSILEEVKPWLLHGDQYQIYNDNDFWFNPSISNKNIKRWKQFLLAWIGVLPWAMTIPITFIFIFTHYYPIPRFLMSIFISLIISWLMTYISMPLLTKKMATWLSK